MYLCNYPWCAYEIVSLRNIKLLGYPLTGKDWCQWCHYLLPSHVTTGSRHYDWEARCSHQSNVPSFCGPQQEEGETKWNLTLTSCSAPEGIHSVFATMKSPSDSICLCVLTATAAHWAVPGVHASLGEGKTGENWNWNLSGGEQPPHVSSLPHVSSPESQCKLKRMTGIALSCCWVRWNALILSLSRDITLLFVCAAAFEAPDSSSSWHQLWGFDPEVSGATETAWAAGGQGEREWGGKVCVHTYVRGEGRYVCVCEEGWEGNEGGLKENVGVGWDCGNWNNYNNMRV